MTPEMVAWTGLLLALLVALSWIDLRTYRLPDALTLPLIAAGLAQRWWRGEPIVDGLIGALVGYLAFVLIEKSYKRLRGQDGLGRGDAKLLAAGGAWCGWLGLPWIVLVASASALALILIYALITRQSPSGAYPFGPFLAVGIASVWLAQTGLVPLPALI